VAERGRALPLIALAALAFHVPAALMGWRSGGLDGLALALALTTAVVLCLLLRELRALQPVVLGLVVVAAVVAAGTALAFVPAALLLSPAPAAGVGVVVYVGLVTAVRPAGLRDAWRYLRALA
jgi:hypothetical protein